MIRTQSKTTKHLQIL